MKIRRVRWAGIQHKWESHNEYILAGKPDDRPPAIFVKK
jgi:hypothetical protein